MKKLYFIILVCSILFPVQLNAQCGIDNTFTGQNVSLTGVGNSQVVSYNAGQFVTLFVQNGASYQISTCAGSSAWDTQLTVYYSSDNSFIAYNDDACGLQSNLSFTATRCENVNVLLDQYSCNNSGQNTSVTFTQLSAPTPDVTPPTITAPADVVTNTNSGCTTTSVALGTPVTSDNCSVFSVVNNAPGTFNLGNTNVTWTVTDQSGNTATANQVVTVNDLENPTITPPANVNANTNSGCTATGVSLGTPVTGDNCSVAGFTNDAPVSFSLGTTVVTWTVTDGSGNTATTTQSVVITDIENPTITCPSTVTTNTDAASCLATGVSLGLPITADNCSVSSTLNNAPLSYAVGTTGVTWTVTDASGNSNVCTQNVIVTDIEIPTITCPADVTANTDAASCLATGVSLGLSITGDNCSVLSTLNNAPVSYAVGTTGITWTVTDANGNSNVCTQNVIVTDIEVPVFVNCPSDISNVTNNSNCTAIINWAAPSATDNCSSSVTSTHNSGDVFPVGTTVVTYTATDASGNSSSCSFNVIVTNDMSIAINATDATCNSLTDGAADALITGGTSPYTYLWDNTATTEDISGLATGNYSLTVTDANGCLASSNTFVNEPALLNANIATQSDPTACGFNDGTILVDVTGGTNPYTYDWDNDGTGDNNDNEDQLTLGSGTYALVVTDANGCTTNVNGNLSDPNGPIITIDSLEHNVCDGDSSGAIYITVTLQGSAVSYTALWSNAATTDDITGLAASLYSVEITDNKGCIGTADTTITEPSPLSLSAVSSDEIFGNDGSIDLTVSGGTPPYAFNWTGGATTEDISGLAAGNYTVNVVDDNNCVTSLIVTVGSQVGVKENLNSAGMIIYPNPASENISLIIDQPMVNAGIIITDMQGRVISTRIMNGNQLNLSVSDFEDGMYMIILNGNHLSGHANFVIAR